MKSVASGEKIGIHREKVGAYLENQRIYPITLELDLTSQCSRVCKDCPSCRSPHHQHLSLDFIKKLLASFHGQTQGLLLTGGEPTISPLFPEVLALARKSGFVNIAVVTNGSQLQEELVVEALLQYASTIRLSMYDWDGDSCSGIKPVLEKIKYLRQRIDQTSSQLMIGISALTSEDRVPKLGEVAESVRNAGAHWIYFHPMCTGWSNANLKQVSQAGVLEAIETYRAQCPDDFGVFVSPSRYQDIRLEFDKYHAAHFLLVIGADGKNYLGAEVKYQEKFVVADVAGNWTPDFLHRSERMAKIDAINSRNYSALNSRHRGVLYNDYIEKIKAGTRKASTGTEEFDDHVTEFLFPHIL